MGRRPVVEQRGPEMRKAYTSQTDDDTLIQALFEYQRSDQFREHTLPVRMTFQAIVVWMPDRERSLRLIEVNASFARRLRDKAARERGWRFGNHVLVLLQTVIASAVGIGMLTVNSVRQVPKLPPPFRQPGNGRRTIQPIRHPVAESPNLPKKETSTA